jgi:hypothetical protein
MTYQEWLDQKYTEWERTQASRQTYYNFARFLDISHTDLTQWISGAARPAGEDLAKIAGKLGEEIYDLLGVAHPNPQFQRMVAAFSCLPTALRQRLTSAVLEIEQRVSSQKMDPESAAVKRLAVKILDKWGFHITG